MIDILNKQFIGDCKQKYVQFTKIQHIIDV